MEIRSAKVGDVEAIYSLINGYAERDRMLFRSPADIYENLQSFLVAEKDGRIVGCCGLDIIWADLAEIKSLAVEQPNKGGGIGRMLVDEAVKRARELGITKVFALTLDTGFFEKLGFEAIDREGLPMKVWRDCARCPKQDNCDETAVIKTVLRSV